ncbi:MAG: CHAT domain-containing protein [Chloroflexi bacterium]|nr:CHAT domain-containing protein [Chloroflexota bacterium]
MLYLSLDLRVSDWDPASRSALVEVLNSPAGEAPPQRVRLEIDPARQGERLLYTEGNAQRLGEQLWQSIMVGEIRDAWSRSYQRAIDRRRGLRLRVHSDDWRLAQLPWELAYDPARQEYLVYDRRLSVVRYARIPSPQPEPVATGQLHVLLVAASPRDQAPLDWEREIELLQIALQELVDEGRIVLSVCEHATAQRLQDRLMETMPEVVHYVGHGEYDATRQTGALLVETANGESARLEAHAVARLLCRYRTQLVFLNACDTARGQAMGLAAALMRGDMPAVVAMQWPVKDDAAMQFGRAFYRGISHDLTVDECMSEGRLAVSTAGGEPADWGAPVLFMRSLSGNLWVPSGQSSASQAAGASVVTATTQPAVVGGESRFLTGRPLRAGQDAGLMLRRDELARILKRARLPAVSQYIAVLGSQYSGKTTLLLQVKDALQAEQACLYCDLGVLHDADLTTCCRHLAFEVAQQLGARLTARQGGALRRLSSRILGQPAVSASLLAEEQLARVQTPEELVGVLEALSAASPSARITLLVDQVDRLPEDVAVALLGALRSMLLTARCGGSPLAKYLVVLAGSLRLQGWLNRRNSQPGSFERLYLGELDAWQVAGALGQFSRLGVPVDEQAPRLVLEATGGHPYLTMRLCAWLERLQPASIDASAIEDAVANMLASDGHLAETVERVMADAGLQASMQAVLAGESLRFVRSDAALSALELIGVITPTTPVRVRSRLYELALRARLPRATPAANTVAATIAPKEETR